MYKVLKLYALISLAFFFLLMMLIFFSDRINIFEYPEFVVFRKEFRFMEIFYMAK